MKYCEKCGFAIAGHETRWLVALIFGVAFATNGFVCFLRDFAQTFSH